MTLSLSALNALRTVAETGSYSAAARRLGLSQPAVSQQIRKIEKDYGVALFNRANGQLLATPFCERACDAAERVMLDHGTLERMFRHNGSLEKGELSVGLGNAMPGMTLIAAFNKAYPAVSLRVTTGSFQKIMRAVVDHSVDVGILPDVPKDPRFRRKILLTNQVVAIASLDHPFTGKQSVDCDQLLREKLIFRSDGSSTQKALDRYFRANGAEPAPFLTLDTRDGVYEAVVNGMGIGFVWKTGTGRNDDVHRIELNGGSTQSHEVIFAPEDRKMQTIEALFSLADSMTFA
jgi:DNA-binding transcriptional LysR family regulator